MIDVITHERIVVHTEGTGVPYLMVADEQLNTVIAALKSHHVPHWVDEDVISLDGEPAVAVVNLGRNANALQVQQMLDTI